MIVLLLLALLLLMIAYLLLRNTHNEVVRDKRARNLGGGASEDYGWNRHKRTGQNG